MPNWVHNSMTITGPAEEIDRFKVTIITELEPDPENFCGGGRFFNFSTLIPVPKGEDPGEYWGTSRWGFWLHDCADEQGYHVSFDTAWSAPIGIFQKIGEMFPNLDITLSGIEEAGHFSFKGTIKAGQLEIERLPFVWSTVDPKTGKTISGSREEIEALGGRGSL
jgi:hypothetical protein